MNNRIKQLREQSLKAINRISAERALLVTEFYKNHCLATDSIPVQRAKAFDYILKNKALCLNPGELIVGERGPAPKATPTYPEITLHSLQDLDILNQRSKVSFNVDEATYNAYKTTIIPFWEGKTQRERIFAHLPNEWQNAYTAGVFTEFQEQRAPGHTVAGGAIFRKGMKDILAEIQQSRQQIDAANDPEAIPKLNQLYAMEIAANALVNYALRYARLLEQQAAIAPEPQRQNELLKMAEICRHVPANAPRTFHEALQHYWFIHIGVITELNPWDSFSPGRLDQHLHPFFERETQNNILSGEAVVELLQSFWIKFNNHPSPPKVGVTAQESNTYTDFALINLGGLKADGSNATNPLTYIILDVIETMRLLQPGTMVQVSKKSPDRLIKRTAEITKTGFGQPSYFNTDAIVQQLLRQGKAIEDARNGGASGCVETGAFGKESYILTGYFNLNKVLEITLNNGRDPKTGQKTGIETGQPADFKSFEELYTAFEAQLNYFIDIKIKGNNCIEKLYSNYLPVPFLSLIIDNCIGNAKDYNAGGATYNTSYIQGVGIGSIADNLTALKHHVFDKQHLLMTDFLAAMRNNYDNFDDLRHDLLYETPKYGNNTDAADQHAVRVFNSFFRAVDGRPTPRGAVHRINLLPTTSHVYFGSKIGAMPDGRKAGEPLSEGISPVQGMDANGPTAVLLSAAKLDHLRTGGTLLNQKLSPEFFDNPEAIQKFMQLIRSYFTLDGHHIQFNVVSAETLRDAQKYPEKHQDLIVRVAGYSDYFNALGRELQDEIIRRNAHCY